MTVTCYLCDRPVTGKVCEIRLEAGSYAYVCAECAKRFGVKEGKE